MKEYALELVKGIEGYDAKLNTLREYLQAYALRVMHNEGVFRSTAFVGGTALRFLYGLPRFSEDLGFSSEKGKPNYTFAQLMVKIKSEFELSGYNISVVYDDTKTVNDAFFKFEGLLYEAGLSPLKSRKMSIRLEIDTNPPKGAVLVTQLVNKYFPITFLAYDTASLFSAKVHALLSRRYTKGRDFFDLGWYLSRWKGIIPNLDLLAQALKQTGWKREMPTQGNWRGLLKTVVEKADWDTVKKDVEHFLENPSDVDIFTKENILHLLHNA